MSLVLREDLDGGVVRLSLNNGGGNAISPALLDALVEALAPFDAAPPRALVLDGGTAKLFSGGFDLPTIHAWDRPALRTFMERFMDVLDRILRVECPSVAALHSHAMAGGFILSLATDFRILQRSDRLQLGLNEVDLGAAVPAGTLELFAARTTNQIALRYGTTGRLFGPEEALAIGYADELVDDAQARGLELAAQLAAKPGRGAAVTPTFRNGGLRDRVRAADEAYLDAFLDTWFSAECQARLKAVAERLSSRR